MATNWINAQIGQSDSGAPRGSWPGARSLGSAVPDPVTIADLVEACARS